MRYGAADSRGAAGMTEASRHDAWRQARATSPVWGAGAAGSPRRFSTGSTRRGASCARAAWPASMSGTIRGAGSGSLRRSGMPRRRSTRPPATWRSTGASRSALPAALKSWGLGGVRSTAIEIETVFADFDDYWRPFTHRASAGLLRQPRSSGARAPSGAAGGSPAAAVRRRHRADRPGLGGRGARRLSACKPDPAAAREGWDG
jgi:hypothetical protein